SHLPQEILTAMEFRTLSWAFAVERAGCWCSAEGIWMLSHPRALNHCMLLGAAIFPRLSRPRAPAWHCRLALTSLPRVTSAATAILTWQLRPAAAARSMFWPEAAR